MSPVAPLRPPLVPTAAAPSLGPEPSVWPATSFEGRLQSAPTPLQPVQALVVPQRRSFRVQGSDAVDLLARYGSGAGIVGIDTEGGRCTFTIEVDDVAPSCPVAICKGLKVA